MRQPKDLLTNKLLFTHCFVTSKTEVETLLVLWTRESPEQDSSTTNFRKLKHALQVDQCSWRDSFIIYGQLIGAFIEMILGDMGTLRWLAIRGQEKWEICITDNLFNHITPINCFDHNFNKCGLIKRLVCLHLILWAYLQSKVVCLEHPCRVPDVHKHL